MYSQRNLKSGNLILKILLPIIFIGFAATFTAILLFLKTDPDQKEVVKILNDLKFQGDNLSALPKNPPQIVSGHWR